MEAPKVDEAKKPDKVGCLPFLLGAVVGFVLVLMWSRSQVHTLGAGQVVVRGESRSILVLAHALIGAFAGGLLVTFIALVRRRLKKRDAPRE